MKRQHWFTLRIIEKKKLRWKKERNETKKTMCVQRIISDTVWQFFFPLRAIHVYVSECMFIFIFLFLSTHFFAISSFIRCFIFLLLLLSSVVRYTQNFKYTTDKNIVRLFLLHANISTHCVVRIYNTVMLMIHTYMVRTSVCVFSHERASEQTCTHWHGAGDRMRQR